VTKVDVCFYSMFDVGVFAYLDVRSAGGGQVLARLWRVRRSSFSTDAFAGIAQNFLCFLSASGGFAQDSIGNCQNSSITP